MKLIIWLLALFAAAVAVTLAAKYATGHASIVMPPYQLELSLEHFIIGVVAAFFVFYILVRLILGIFGYSQHYRHKKTDTTLLSGLKSYFEGNYAKAQKNAATALKLTDSPIITAISAVIAARSAHELDDTKARDQYIDTALRKAPAEKSLSLMAKADFLLSEGNHQEALETLHGLYANGGLQPSSALQLELKAQQQANNWDAVLELANILAKRQSTNQALVKKLKHDAQLENIKRKGTDLHTLNHYWQSLAPLEKMDSKVAAAATRAYIALGSCSTAHQIIEQNVPVTWDNELIELYAECLDYHVNRQIECAEVWLKSHPNNAQLLLTLGKLCTHCELWGKAQNYLEASLSVEPGQKAHFALAQLNEKLGKHELAMDHYNKGLELTLKQLS
ncbi:heme biosynthesis protein HemY [Nitrosomonas sp. JL21]|uniref:heme biosynthesis HemY N-terminal domain-containing protein n=1 Tax=Nitrosomonas sp. JL21 TaxID=153949 RepID=UPI00136F0AD7|nr:heme biosynthesis HemY N-terminal domain-containing protein [Nitrosomonas sp. JL21]MBL8497228.1 heme biosynthesis protein HemY [Nitrosomonas sp.]MCC7090461.1 heme biosynthesis protein HemY [Nitrosomonas sp.]MXS77097.1 heme biosynthesis protein HemY [Nitrosomonas sp. JL21]